MKFVCVCVCEKHDIFATFPHAYVRHRHAFKTYSMPIGRRRITHVPFYQTNNNFPERNFIMEIDSSARTQISPFVRLSPIDGR